MLSAAYAVARWVEYVSGALALIALATIAWRLLKGPDKRVLGPVSMLVATGVICAGTFVFLDTGVEQVRLDSVSSWDLRRIIAVCARMPLSMTSRRTCRLPCGCSRQERR